MKTFNLKLATVFLSTVLLLSLFGCDKDEVTNVDDHATDTEILAGKGAPNKIDICHYSADDDQWILINVSENAWADHVLHGDVRLDDQDGDGFVPDNACGFGTMGDCDDNNAAVNPGAEEICDNGIDDNCNGETDENCAQPAEIGDIREGGVVFYIADEPTDLDGDGVLDIGLVCALSDYATTVGWGCFGTDLQNVPNVITFPPSGDGAEIGDGMSNTNAILADCPTAPAALAARSNGPEWFLPSAKELNEMYLNKATLEAVPGFSAFSSHYWSSSEFSNYGAWLQNFFDGFQYGYNKYFTNDVRAVRAF